MFEKLFLSTLVAIWFGALALLVTYESDRVILFGRIFIAVCIGIARTIGIA